MAIKRKKRGPARRKRVGSSDNTVLIVGGLAVGAAVLYFMTRPATMPTTIIRTIPTSSSASSTAATVAEIAAGGAAITSIINSFSDNS